MIHSRGQYHIVSFLLVTLLLVSGVAFAAPEFSVQSLMPGDSGADVILLQEELIKLGLIDEITGEYNEATLAAVAHMQKQTGAEVSGIFTPELLIAYTALVSANNGIKEMDPPSETDAPPQSPLPEPSPTPIPSDEPPADAPLATAEPAASPLPLPTAEAPAPLLPLCGLIIGIDPGHQLYADTELEPIAPSSPYTRAKMTAGVCGIRTCIPEYKTALQVSFKLRSLLENAGATVVMTRTANDVSVSNIQRASIMNESCVDMWVRIHCNYSHYSRHIHGASILVPSAAYSADISDASFALGRSVLNEFCASTGALSLSIRKTSLQTGFNWSDSPVVTIELGYLSNPAEDIRLNRNSYQIRCADGIYQGILSYVSTR